MRMDVIIISTAEVYRNQSFDVFIFYLYDFNGIEIYGMQIINANIVPTAAKSKTSQNDGSKKIVNERITFSDVFILTL